MRFALLAASAALAVSACAAGPRARQGAPEVRTPVAVTAASELQKARVLYFPVSCADVLAGATPNNEAVGLLAALVGPLATIVANTITDYIEARMQAARDARTGSFAAIGVGQALGGDNPGCIAVVNGRFGEPAPGVVENGPLTLRGLRTLRQADYPDFLALFEARLANANLRLDAQHIHYGATSAASAGSGVKTVTIAFSLTATTPASTGDASSANGALSFGKLEIGKFYSGSTLTADTLILPLPEDGATNPFSIVAFVTETEEPDLALKLLVDNFSSEKDDIATAIADWLKSLTDKDEDEGDGDS